MGHFYENHAILKRILETKQVKLPDGSFRPLTSASSPSECNAMYEWIIQNKPETVIEIGMAYGVSALTILHALERNGTGRLISIDPYIQFDSARQSALLAISESGLSHRHQHLHDRSEFALPQLVQSGQRAQFIYIDGHHGFDHAFLDMFFSDLLLSTHGVLSFDDSQWRSVHKVIKYLLKHRKYDELDLGLQRHYGSSNPFFTAIKWATGRFGSTRYFRKTGDWSAPFDFFCEF